MVPCPRLLVAALMQWERAHGPAAPSIPGAAEGVVAPESCRGTHQELMPAVRCAGTHDWSKFLTPQELCMVMGESSGGAMVLEQVAGMMYNPLTGGWALGTDTAMNYAAYFRKQA